MTALPMVIKPIRDSVAAAAVDVRAAAEDALLVRPAIRDVSLALENHLDTIVRELHGSTEPRLMHRARQLESDLRAALTETWAIDRDMRSGPIDIERLLVLAKRLEDAASAEFDFVSEQLRDDGALD